MRKETGGRNAAVVETATQLRQRLARYQPPTTDVNSYHHPPAAMPNHAGFHPPACHPLCAPRRHSPTAASSAGLIVRMVGVRAMAFPLLPQGYKLPLLPVSSLPMLSAIFNAGARNACSRAGGRLSRTGRGNPGILGERHVSPRVLASKGVLCAREVTAPVQSRLSLVVDVRMRYLAPDTDLQSPSSFLCGHLTLYREDSLTMNLQGS
ncbi:hypothetical protein G5I_09160 [Acromyrmex echinatior]|uniref:Uncharacterized protein n=1 Tax=Acromyrmex echinatior TaxID=103372 RepID=F4WTG2_ACREC|nr:hypothetical protein G5I_09160 [Acromyrmex echinatior]